MARACCGVYAGAWVDSLDGVNISHRSIVALVALSTACSCERSRPGRGGVTGGAPRSTPPLVVSREVREHRPRLLLTPGRLEALRQGAARGSALWRALAARCEAIAKGRVEYPDGEDYPSGGVGEGYQGEGYLDAVAELGLCFQIERDASPKRAQGHAAAAARVLSRMSELEGAHAVDPLRDSGYGVRFYVTAMALGYDWVGDALDEADRARLRAAMHRWVAAYERSGFGRDHPQGNYYAGYYAAKALAALAVEGDGEPGAVGFDDWLTRVHLGNVQPYYAVHLRGGGWPEGWNYGAVGSVNMILPALATRTAKGLDLVRADRAPYAFPVDQARYLVHFTWPDRGGMDDRGMVYDGVEPSAPSAALATVVHAALVASNDPFAATFHGYARALREGRRARPASTWHTAVFWDETAPEAPVRLAPRTYLARGVEAVATRSSWDDDAVWASFTSGPYVGNPDSGEMFFDQGSLVVVRGGKPLLCNAHAGLLRHTPGTRDGAGVFDAIHAELFGKPPAGGARTIFNVLRVDAQAGGQLAVDPSRARTRIGALEDEGSHVLVKGVDLADMYRRGKTRPVKRWTRTVLYLRPATFVVHDESEPGDGLSLVNAFHLCGGVTREGATFTMASNDAALTTVWPRGADARVVDVLGRGKVRRVELRATDTPAGTTRWLTVLDVAAPAPARRAAPLALRSGEGEAAVVEGGATPLVVVFSRGNGPLAYDAPEGARHHVVGAAPASNFAVTKTQQPGGVRVEVRPAPGGDARSTAAGVLTF